MVSVPPAASLAVKRHLQVDLAPFALESLEEEAERQRTSLGTVLRHAMLYYLSERDARRVATRVPTFAQGARGDSERRVHLELEPPEWRDLEQAALRERVTLAALVEHAAMVYLVDYDLGRVGTRLLETTRP
jgi:predicted DNA-binding ribbon-helix-helix protein